MDYQGLRATSRLGVRCALLASSCAIGLASAAAAADPSEIRAALQQLLRDAWEPSPAANAQLDADYQRLAGAADWRIDYAYALGKMRQWQYSEAADIAQRLTEDRDAELSARSMLAWLLLLQKKYAAGLAQLERIVEALPSGDELSESDRERREDMIRRVGRMFGYLDTPVEDKLSEFERASRRRRMARRMSAEELELFDQESRAVAEQFLTNLDEKDRIAEESKRKAEEERARRLEEIAAQQRAAVDRLAELDKERSRTQDELQEKLREFEDRDAPLRERYAALDAEATILNRNLAGANADLLRIDEQLQFEDDPIIRDLLLSDLARISALASGYSRNLTQLESSAATVQRERRVIAGQQRQVENQYRSQLADNAAQQQALLRQARRNEVEEKRLLREKPRTSGQARSLAAHARAFTTYVPFPFEDARHRLLESF